LKFLLKVILLPFSILYGIITWFRNKLFDFNFYKSYSSSLTTICIGNLSAGGTGKTPMIGYIHTILAKENIPLATLSRGYGRTTHGFMLADRTSTSSTIGDEPLQLYQDFGTTTTIAVCEKRVVGMQQLEAICPKNTYVLLDDAYQHRWLKPSKSILLTTFQDPFFNDFMLPSGRLREFSSGAQRANAIVVTKCPNNLSQFDKTEYLRKLARYSIPVFFSSIVYKPLQPLTLVNEQEPKHIILVSAIGNATPLIKHLEQTAPVSPINFPDHHSFTLDDLMKIHQKYTTFTAQKTIIVCTQKDWVKLSEAPLMEHLKNYPWYCQYIGIELDNEQEFKEILK
jgi:tetraacyldisaccharide 4'-kinase